MNQHLQTISNLIQQSQHLSDEEKTILFKATRDANKEFEITAIKLVRTEKVKKETAILLKKTIAELEHKRKAVEAYNSELEIEASLERVRSRTMAMHQTSELQDVIHTVHEELLNLKLYIDGGSFVIINNDVGTELHCWGSGGTANTSEEILVPHFDMPFCTNLMKGIKRGAGFFTEDFSQEEKKEYFTKLFDLKPWSELSSEQKKEILSSAGGYTRSVAVSKYTSIFIINHYGRKFTEAENTILQRFAKVFEQTYTRFLDLQKAEGQAREAQIELALERVRARTMAMHKSDELPEISFLLFQQLREVGETAVQNSIAIVNEEIGFVELSTTIHGSHLLHTINVPTDDPHVIAKGVAAWKSKHKSLTLNFEGQALKEYNELRNGFLETKISFPEDQWIVNLSFFSKGWLSFSSNKNVHGEIVAVQKRFASVFEQTYTRFLDLQKAESQAREARIEAAMEKVRSKAMAMQKPDELIEVAQLLRTEMGLLGVEELETSSIYIHNEATQQTECWYAIQKEGKLVSDHMTIELKDTWVGKQMTAFYISGKERTTIVMQGEARKEWINYCADHSKLLVGFYEDNIPDRNYHLYKFSSGYMGAASSGDISPESWDLLKSATTVFSLAYTRFSDLQIAQAHAMQAERDLIAIKEAKQNAELAFAELQVTQKQLIQSEKMASLGELTAGIAHEIQNPLNFVNNFSEVSKELLDEMKTELDAGHAEDAKAIANDIIQNLEKINHHGKRADAIVKNMLQHSRSRTDKKEPTDINALADEYLRLSYHGLRAKDKSFTATLKTDFDTSLEKISINPQDIGRVILNLLSNAFYVINEKKKLNIDGYEPTVSVSTKRSGNKIEISVKDNGTGIPQKVLDKIYQPFFTTKPTGEGTGLGLSLSYDIITKGHGGELKVETTEGEESMFIIQLPA